LLSFRAPREKSINNTMRKEYKFYIYILINYSKTVFYIGFTNNIIRRIIEHKNDFGCNFTRKYKLKYLIYFEECENAYSGMEREKEIKKWRREKKINLIKSINPNLIDISGNLFRDNDITEKEIEETTRELRGKYKV
jgi:putative endonuclease